MKRLITASALCIVMLLGLVPYASAADTNYTQCMTAIAEQKNVQAQAHQVAESLRRQGYSNSNAYIQAAKATWNEAQKEIVAYRKLAAYSDEDIRILTNTVYNEAGNTTEQLRGYVAQVVLNRVANSRFPNTVKAVIEQPGQYSKKYSTTEMTATIKNNDAKNGTTNWITCQNSVKRAMMGKVDMPANVVYQANFRQGSGLWKSVYYNSGWYSSTSYFCYM